MNTLSSKLQNHSEGWEAIFSFENNDDLIKHEAQMLMFSFLSETEKYQTLQKINKKDLAKCIKTSASYITQIFRGNKPLNFETIAKIQLALNIKFNITASPINFEMYIDEDAFIDLKSGYKTKNGMWLYRNFTPTKQDEVYENEYEVSLIDNTEDIKKALFR
jgi:transcriptional regulator with XRE-family HTH domain